MAGIVLSWTMNKTPETEAIASYQLYAYQESSQPPTSALWKKVGSVKALELPMACTLTQVSVRAVAKPAVIRPSNFNNPHKFYVDSTILASDANLAVLFFGIFLVIKTKKVWPIVNQTHYFSSSSCRATDITSQCVRWTPRAASAPSPSPGASTWRNRAPVCNILIIWSNLPALWVKIEAFSKVYLT